MSRRCDCGCRRPAAFLLTEYDLAFARACEHLYVKAIEQLYGVDPRELMPCD